MRLSCPNYNHTILSRRNPLCGFCREPLPEELLFTPAEIEAQGMERAAKVAPSIVPIAESGSPTGFKPILR